MAVLVILLLAALIFGISGVIKGVFWAILIGLALIGLAAVLGFRGAGKAR